MLYFPNFILFSCTFCIFPFVDQVFFCLNLEFFSIVMVLYHYYVNFLLSFLCVSIVASSQQTKQVFLPPLPSSDFAFSIIMALISRGYSLKLYFWVFLDMLHFHVFFYYTINITNINSYFHKPNSIFLDLFFFLLEYVL